jgi:hypothetical protein
VGESHNGVGRSMRRVACPVSLTLFPAVTRTNFRSAE